MTNGEKAKVEAIKILEWVHGDKTASPNFITDTITRLLDEKDNQFKEYLEKKQTELDGTRNKSNYELITEIINEHFKEK